MMVLATPVKYATLITGGPGETKEDAWFHWIKIERGKQPHTERHRHSVFFARRSKKIGTRIFAEKADKECCSFISDS
jgi:hypothetical protein